MLVLLLLVAAAFAAGRFGAMDQAVEPHMDRVSLESAPAAPQQSAPQPSAPGMAPEVPTGPQAAPVAPPPSAPPPDTRRPPAQPAISAGAPVQPPVQPPAAPSESMQRAALPPPPPPPEGGPMWRKHAVPGGPAEGRPRIVVVIDDMGVDRRRSARITALPGPLTLAWLPYARDVAAQVVAARQRGHEMIVHVPMEPGGREDPGPNALLSRLEPEELRRRLALNLAAFDGYVGINNHMGSRFTADREGMAIVLAELSARGLLFLDSRTTAETQAPALAEVYGLPVLSRDVFLDHVQTAKGVATALAKLEEVARRDGIGIAIGHPHDVTAAALERWLPTLEDKGLELIPLSAAVPQNREGL